MFLIDASPAMFRPAPAASPRAATTASRRTIAGGSSRSFVDVAVDYARSVLRSRIVSTPNDRQGVAFFATNARGTADDAGAGAGAGARENVWVEQHMNVPCARRIQDLADLVARTETGDSGTRSATPAEKTPTPATARIEPATAWHRATTPSSAHPSRGISTTTLGAKVRKRLLLFTNRDARSRGRGGRTRAHQRVAGVPRRARIDVTLYSLPYTAGGDGYRDFDPTVFTAISPPATTTTATKDKA